MTFEEKKIKAQIFFDRLSKKLSQDYSVMASYNQDISAYLVPNGTQGQVTYYSKPAKSFRISDHWNWYANLNKCSDPNYIQCLSVDVPRAKPRLGDGKASKPVYAIQVAYIAEDGKYHCVYGESFNRKTKQWEWIESDPIEVAGRVMPKVVGKVYEVVVDSNNYGDYEDSESHTHGCGLYATYNSAFVAAKTFDILSLMEAQHNLVHRDELREYVDPRLSKDCVRSVTNRPLDGSPADTNPFCCGAWYWDFDIYVKERSIYI